MKMEDQEREVKFYIQDLEAIAERLRVCGADLTRDRTLERNLRFDTQERSLQGAGRLLRLRQDDRARVTYKENARVEGGVIARTEIEFTVDNFAVARKLFEALGYQVVVMYEKYRRVYRLGDVEVTLDEMPFGNFIEIEAANNVLIEGVAQMLGLDWSKGIATNYLGLFEIARAKRGFTFNDLTFENFGDVALLPEDMGVEAGDIGISPSEW
jgi:adenylate cyclase class 2